MKRHLSLLAILLIAFVANAANYGYNSNEVPADWQNDLWVNFDYVEMTKDSVHKIVARRVPEIVETDVSKEVILPKFHYTIVEGNNVKVSEDGKITATELGRSIIEITYDATKAFNRDYAKCSDINKTYVVVNVIDKSIEHGITITTDIKPGHYDTYYYATGNGFDLTFNADIKNATDTIVTLNGDTIKGNLGKYIVRLKNRANIIEIEAKNAKGSKRWAQVIDARKVDIKVENLTSANEPIRVGDKAQISFKGITLPVYKLSTIYNPQSDYENAENPSWNSYATRIIYKNNKLGEVKNVNPSQYELATNNNLEITFEEDGEYIFNSGYINENWWGKPLGSEKYSEGQIPSEGLAPTLGGNFSKLPAFRIQVQPKLDAYKDIVTFDIKKAISTTEIQFDSIVWNQTYSDKEITDGLFTFSHTGTPDPTYPSWNGFTISKSHDNAIDNNDFKRQWGCINGGGIDSLEAPYLMSYYPDFFKNKQLCRVIFKEQDVIALGAYVNNSTRATANIINGLGAKKFNKGDYFKLTAYGLKLKGENYIETGDSVEFYLADYRDDNPENWIFNESWEWMDLKSLGKIDGVCFTLESTDKNQWGMLTSSYFAMDKITYAKDAQGNAVEDINTESLSIYPNPCQNILYIDNAAGELVTIYNLQGQIVLNETVGMNGVDVSRLNSGVYVVRCLDKTEKLMIK